MPIDVTATSDLRPGDFYEDCFYQPCLCISVLDKEVSGISLVDGSYPRTCEIHHCGVRKLTFDEAMRWKFFGPLDIETFRRAPMVAGG